MTGMLRTDLTRVVVINAAELADRLHGFAVFSSVHGHAQAPVVIRIDDKAIPPRPIR